MGIKMGAAFDSAGVEWSADCYAKGRGKEPLSCIYCRVEITHQSAHTRERDDKPVLVPAYFRLLPGGRHAVGCKHLVSDEIKAIARDSKDLIESIRDGQYRLRLVMIRDALNGLSKTPQRGGHNRTASRGSTTYQPSRSKLPAYINSAKRVLQLRALCDDDDEIAAHLELVFDGSLIVPWSQFYFETERYLDAYHTLARSTEQFPIALHGIVRSVRTVPSKNGQTNVLNLAKPKYVPYADNPEVGVGVEASVWCEDADWLTGLNQGDEVIILGMWRARAAELSESSRPGQYRYKAFMTHKLSVTLVLPAQIARLPSK